MNKFLSPAGNGMVAEIAERKANQFISIRHLGYVVGGVDVAESEDTVPGRLPARTPPFWSLR